MKSISDINHVFYINLEHRVDRRQNAEEQLRSVGFSPQRFNALKMDNGAIGCSFSHLKILETAKKEGWSHVVIVEDDVYFTQPDLFVKQTNKFLEKHEGKYDVILFSGNNIPPYREVDDCCVQVRTCQTATCYLVMNHYFDTLIDNFKTGLRLLMKEPHNHVMYALDKFWFLLQCRDRWYMIIPLSVVQKPSYSDIEKRNVNYKNVMLDLDKTEWMKRMSMSFS